MARKYATEEERIEARRDRWRERYAIKKQDPEWYEKVIRARNQRSQEKRHVERHTPEGIVARKETEAKYRKRNRKRLREYHAEWRKVNAESYKRQQRNRTLEREYEFSLDDYEQMLVSQNGLCAVCGKSGGAKGLVVDHDHSTGAVRALLCGNCNTALGLFEESTDRMRRAVAYLSLGSNGRQEEVSDRRSP